MKIVIALIVLTLTVSGVFSVEKEQELVYRGQYFDSNGASVRHGKCSFLSKQGRLFAVGEYMHGKKSGLWTYYKYSSEVSIRPDSTEIGNYDNDKRSGPWIEVCMRDENTMFITRCVLFQNGKANGLVTVFQPGFNFQSLGSNVDDKLDGKYIINKRPFDSERQYFEGNYEAGIPVGIWREIKVDKYGIVDILRTINMKEDDTERKRYMDTNNESAFWRELPAKTSDTRVPGSNQPEGISTPDKPSPDSAPVAPKAPSAPDKPATDTVPVPAPKAP